MYKKKESTNLDVVYLYLDVVYLYLDVVYLYSQWDICGFGRSTCFLFLQSIGQPCDEFNKSSENIITVVNQGRLYRQELW